MPAGAWIRQGLLLPAAALVRLVLLQGPGAKFAFLQLPNKGHRRARGRTPQAAGRCRQPVPSRFSSPFQSPSQWLQGQEQPLEYEASPRRIRVVGYGLGIPLDGRECGRPAGFQPPIQPRMRGEPRLRVPKRLWNRILLSVRARVLAQGRARARRRARSRIGCG